LPSRSRTLVTSVAPMNLCMASSIKERVHPGLIDSSIRFQAASMSSGFTSPRPRAVCGFNADVRSDLDSIANTAGQNQSIALDYLLFAAACTAGQNQNQRAQTSVANAPRPFGGSSLSLVSHFVSPLSSQKQRRLGWGFTASHSVRTGSIILKAWPHSREGIDRLMEYLSGF
jgi:hypothetical protein